MVLEKAIFDNRNPCQFVRKFFCTRVFVHIVSCGMLHGLVTESIEPAIAQWLFILIFTWRQRLHKCVLELTIFVLK